MANDWDRLDAAAEVLDASPSFVRSVQKLADGVLKRSRKTAERTDDDPAALQALASAEDINDEDTFDNHRNPPRPDPACLYGLIGDVARAGSETTEANPYAIAANFIAFMSCAVGRGPYMPVGNTWHHCRQFVLHTGRSGRGRKGDAVSLITRIERALRALSENHAPQVHRGGLSSREGLAYLIHDGFKEGKDEVPPVLDKRLLVIESEFANVLHQGKRDGNTLSAALRDCWDGVSLRPATKTSRMWATDPHINVVAAITPTELRGLMASRELTNGFANRFLAIWAERTRMLAFPQATPQKTVDELAEKVLKVLQFCDADRWAERDHMRVELSPNARTRYEALYMGELNDNSAGERITALIERRAPMLLRLAMLFALCDLKKIVEVEHIEAALAWVRYGVESVKFIFGSAADEVQVAETNDTAEKIVQFLALRKEATRSQISRELFKGHTTKTVLDGAIDELLSCNPPRIELETKPREKGSPGTATKVYRLAAKSANSAKREDSRGLAGDSQRREFCEVSEVSPDSEPTVRTVRTVREASEQAQPSVSTRNSQSSHISHATREGDGVEVF